MNSPRTPETARLPYGARLGGEDLAGLSVRGVSITVRKADRNPITRGLVMDVPHVLYRMFNRDGVLLYVGITNNPKGRFRTHSESQPWWSEVVNITLEHLPSRLHRQTAESNAIKDEGPLYNIARPAGAYVPEPTCPSCASSKPDLMPVEDYELLTEDGELVPFCTDPFHFLPRRGVGRKDSQEPRPPTSGGIITVIGNCQGTPRTSTRGARTGRGRTRSQLHRR